MRIALYPKKALSMVLSSKQLLLISFLPGILTLFLSVSLLISAWNMWLFDKSTWISVPILFIAFPLLWIIIGNLALIPFEDLIIDKVQKLHFGEVKIASPKFQMNRVVKELVFSISISIFFLLLMLLSLIPGFAILSYFAAAWITAWSFLSTYYARIYPGLNEKLSTFFRNIFENSLLGAFINLVIFVPIINVWLLGYSLVLATLVQIDREKQ